MSDADLARQLSARLEVLRGELAAGERRLAELESERANLQATMLRISGAIQVLEEELAASDRPDVRLAG
jgi:hypothetical protein